MKKIILLSAICLGISGFTFAQKLTKKDSKVILEKTWTCVKTNDTAGFVKLWALDEKQWPYHAGQKFTEHDVKVNFGDFKRYFDVPLAKNMKIDAIECDTLSKDDPHYDFAKYYIRAWFNISATERRGFGFYMDYVGDKWLVRFSPDYSVDKPVKK